MIIHQKAFRETIGVKTDPNRPSYLGIRELLGLKAPEARLCCAKIGGSQKRGSSLPRFCFDLHPT